jgi:hypothetical protein
MQVVNIKRGSKFDVYIGRPSKWGNPFKIGSDGTRAEVIAKYKAWLWQKMQANEITLDDLLTLRGKTLGCYCKPNDCHGDVIMAAVKWAVTIKTKEHCNGT